MLEECENLIVFLCGHYEYSGTTDEVLTYLKEKCSFENYSISQFEVFEYFEEDGIEYNFYLETVEEIEEDDILEAFNFVHL